MSDYLTQEVPWDNEEELIDREPESSGGGLTHFGFLQLFPLKVTKVFEAGHFLTIPGVTGGQYNDKDEKGLMKFKGWQAGGNQWLFVLVATKQDKDGTDYQIVKQLPSKLQRKGDPHLWADFTFPSLKNLSNAERSKMTKEGVYCQWSEAGTGHKVEIDGKEIEIKAWVNFTVYPDKVTMKQTEKTFWNERNSGGESGGVTGTHYPASWIAASGGVQSMIDWGKTLTFENHKDLATQMSLFTEAKPDGSKLTEEDVRLVLSEILDIAPPFVDLS